MIFVRRDRNSPRPTRPVIAAGGMTDFGRAAHNIDATGVATLAARAHEGMAAAASAGLSAPIPPKQQNSELNWHPTGIKPAQVATQSGAIGMPTLPQPMGQDANLFVKATIL